MHWHNYFIDLALAVATKSKDPSTKVGALIVDPHNRIVSVGYNGPPRGTDDTIEDRKRRLERTLHAEENAILFARQSLEDCTLYCTHPPCTHCAAVIIQSGIQAVFYPEPDEAFELRWMQSLVEARRMFDEAGVDYGWADPPEKETT